MGSWAIFFVGLRQRWQQLAATRLWPKKGCDDNGENCLIGQSSKPCPAGGCPPPVDSKVEATWGCTLSDQTQCNDVTTSAYAALNLNIFNSSAASIGCYAPCTLLTYPTFGGKAQTNTDNVANLYCCPTPPISSAQCNAGPVVNTNYVTRVHSMCNSSVYTFAYDDTKGLRNCSAVTQVSVTYGPNCP